MLFSEHFNFVRDPKDDWYNPILSFDTKLFIDPFLIYSFEKNEFVGSHNEVINFFNAVFQLIAKSNGDKNNIHYRRGRNLLIFPEAEELCLGYASQTTKGAGSGVGFSKIIADALWEAIKSGLKEIKHFEEVGILREGIGADRISDITANLLRHRFARYTSNICKKYKIPLQKFTIRNGIYNPKFERWNLADYLLPFNPYNKKPILLSPQKYLRDLPSISADDFWDYCWSNENQILRDDYSADITKNVDKKTIVEFARKHPEVRARYINKVEKRSPKGYDFKKDKKGLVQWYYAASQFCLNNPLYAKIETYEDFNKTIRDFIKEYINFIENNRGWKLLWNDTGVPKSEESAQLLFLGILKHYCKANDIDISKEVNVGRGPVDFKLSRGFNLRTLIELKLTKNTRFWNGLKRQLPTYLEAEDISFGFFIVIIYTDEDYKKINGINDIIKELNKHSKYKIQSVTVDARQAPLSASKL